MKIIAEFRKFILRGNIAELAIGFTVGAAFTAIVKSLVEDIILPPVSYFLGSADFSNNFLVLRDGKMPFMTLAEAQQAGAITLNYGRFLNGLLSLLIIGITMFFVVRWINRMNDRLEQQFGAPKKTEDPSDKKCQFCLSTIPYSAVKCAHCTADLPAANK